MCLFLEIPLLMGYYPQTYQRSGFFAQLGITSYLMLREQYDYSYEFPNAELVQKWVGKNKNQHWFGIGQVAIGYQKRFNKKLSLQFVPYIQIPLTGIGHGAVNLWSTGLQVKSNFNLK